MSPRLTLISRLIPLLALAVAALAGCGESSGSPQSTGTTGAAPGAPGKPIDAHGEPRAQARAGVEAAAHKFLDSMADRDPAAFCEVVLPELQRPNFADIGAPAGDCEERARAMFDVDFEDGYEPFWAAAAQATVGSVKLNCPATATDCARATVALEDLPLREGGTTTAPTPFSFAGGRWRAGHYWVEVSGETPFQERHDPVTAAQGFLDSLTEQDPAAFCELTLPAAQQSTFDGSGAPAGGSCEQRAREMFGAPYGQGPEPLWAREARAVLGQINLRCPPSGACAGARIRIESLPLAGGGTTIAPMTVVVSHGRWRVGRIEAAPLGGGPEGGAQA